MRGFSPLTIIRTRVLALALAGLAVAAVLAKPAVSAPPPLLDQELTATPLPPSFYARTFRIPVFDVDTGRVRYMTAFRDMDRKFLESRLRDYTGQAQSPFPKAPILRRTDDGGVDCDCAQALGPNEFLISEDEVRDSRQGRYVSLNDESYKAIQELIAYPLQDDETIAVAFSELVYVYNARALDRFLGTRGFDLVHSHGFMDSPTFPGIEDTQFVLVRERTSGRYIVGIRGTSGVADLKTNVNARMEPWRGQGKVHSGFVRTAEIILAELEPYRDRMQAAGPVMVVGHSLGGAATVLLTLGLRQAGEDAYAISIAPPPVGDRAFEQAYAGVGKALVNIFLPGEELDTADRPKEMQWMRLVGHKRYLEDVGKTAGAVHFVINYLKSTLKRRGDDMRAYAHALPICVLEKYHCFDPGVLQFAAMCLFDDWRCFEENADYLLGLEPMAGHLVAGYLDAEIAGRAAGRAAALDQDWRQGLAASKGAAKRKLLSGVASEHRRRLVMFRVGLLSLVLGDYDEAERFLALVAAGDGPSVIARYYRIAALVLGGRVTEAVEASVALFNADPPAEISERARRLLWRQGES